jgi:hypothetical protein
MFCVFPIVLIGLALWFDFKLPRPSRTTALAAALAGGAVLCVPFGFLYQRAPSTETWALVLPEILTRKVAQGGYDIQILIVAGVVIALALFALLRPRLALLAIPLALVAYFAVSQLVIVHEVGRTSSNYRGIPGVGVNASWIDQAVPVDQRVSLILGTPFGPDVDRLILWQLMFFNRTMLDVNTWGTDLLVAADSGAVTTPEGQVPNLNALVITPTTHVFEGDTVVVHEALTMQRPAVPQTLKVRISGVFPDDWTGPSASIDYFATTDVRMVHVHIDRTGIPSSVPATQATVSTGPLVADDQGAAIIGKTTGSTIVEISSAAGADFELAVPPAPFRMQLAFEPSFRPSDYGQEDTRDLGAHVLVTLGSELISR